jgi:hypothetical protein
VDNRQPTYPTNLKKEKKKKKKKSLTCLLYFSLLKLLTIYRNKLFANVERLQRLWRFGFCLCGRGLLFLPQHSLLLAMAETRKEAKNPRRLHVAAAGILVSSI